MPPKSLFAKRTTKKIEKTDQDAYIEPLDQDKNAARIRLDKERADFFSEPLSNVTVEWNDTNDDSYFKFIVKINVVEGFWAGGVYNFEFTIPFNYPFSEPHVTLLDPIWHPNIDRDGKPCVNVLQKNWKPTISLQHVVFGLLFLFTDPNDQDPLNLEAASEMRSNKTLFLHNVKKSLTGGVINGRKFPKNHGDESLFGNSVPKNFIV